MCMHTKWLHELCIWHAKARPTQVCDVCWCGSCSAKDQGSLGAECLLDGTVQPGLVIGEPHQWERMFPVCVVEHGCNCSEKHAQPVCRGEDCSLGPQSGFVVCIHEGSFVCCKSVHVQWLQQMGELAGHNHNPYTEAGRVCNHVWPQVAPCAIEHQYDLVVAPRSQSRRQQLQGLLDFNVVHPRTFFPPHVNVGRCFCSRLSQCLHCETMGIAQKYLREVFL